MTFDLEGEYPDYLDYLEGRKPVPPAHEVCQTTVDEPTLSALERNVDGRSWRVTAMQWYGETDREPNLPDNTQFQFELPIKPDSVYLMDHPGWFRVSYLGPARDWPNPDVAQAIADQITHGNLDGWVVYILSGYIGLAGKHGRTEPASFALPFNILLADPWYGAIRPRPYHNPNVGEEEFRRLHTKPHPRYGNDDPNPPTAA